MSKPKTATASAAVENDGTASLLRQYGCGPVTFSGSESALYRRHLLFVNVVNLNAADQRDRFEALARSVRALGVDRGYVRAREPQTIAEYAAGIWNAEPCPVPATA